MTTNEYIAAIEIGSSKIIGAVGIHTLEGTKILAYASEAAGSYVTKGVIRNVDEAGKSLNSLINRLESQMKNIYIKKVYVAFDCMSIHSVTSKVTKKFDSFTKITQDIIDSMLAENDNAFKVPAGYKKLQVVPQEYKLNGDTNTSPIGTPTLGIECTYLNIIVKEQYLCQLEEAFNMAKIEIIDRYNSVRLESEIILSEEETSCGTALVNIGAEITTIAIHSNRMLRNLTVIPIGSANITKDLCSAQITPEEAEQIKIFKGYASGEKNDSPLSTEKLDNIIAARMSEILKNVQYQLENSGYEIGRIVFTGGGSSLKNTPMLIEENMPNYKYRICNNPQLPYSKDEQHTLATGSITPSLFALLNRGEANCCDEEVLAPADSNIPENLFTGENNVETQQTTSATEEKTEEGNNPAPDKSSAKKKNKKEEEETQQTNTGTGKKPGPQKEWGLGKMMDFFEDWWRNEVINEDDNNDDKEEELV